MINVKNFKIQVRPVPWPGLDLKSIKQIKRKLNVTNTATQDELNTSSPDFLAVIQAQHAQHAETEIIDIYKRSFGQLVEDYLVEKQAKNTAYYFIFSQGHFDSFKNYCYEK